MNSSIISPKVSVTVPIYNAESFLDQCIASLTAQTLKEIEIVLVDDGSTDQSGIICDDWAKKDNRIKVVHQPNGGSAVARQTGLDNSSGEYVTVCDSDDWVELDMYERLYSAAVSADADIVCCHFYAEYENGRRVLRNGHFKHTNDALQLIGEVLRSEAFLLSTCNKLLKHSLFENVSYESGINLGEDALIFKKLLLLHPKIIQIDKALYHYRRRKGQGSYTNFLTMDTIRQGDLIEQWMLAHFDYTAYADVYYRYGVQRIFNCLRAKDLDLGYFNEHLSKDLHWRDFCRYRPTLKSCIVYSCNILPLRIVKFVFKCSYAFFYR
jgi:glycosyltransferase involved in cell wall biosynthesis